MRACVFATGDCGFGVEVVAVVEAPGRDEVVGMSFGAEDMDLGLISLLDVDIGRTVLAGSGCSAASVCVAGLRAAMLLDRSRPKMPEFGLLLVPAIVVAVEVEGIPLRAPVVPARGRVVVAVAVAVIAEDPNFGSLLGELVRGSVVVAFLVAGSSRSSPPLPPPPLPVPGCRSDRDLLKAVAEDEDDML